MDSKRLTNALLLVIAAALLTHVGFVLGARTVEAETFRLDACITDRPGDKPGAYLHVVVHGTADVDSPDRLR